MPITRRELIRSALASAATLALPGCARAEDRGGGAVDGGDGGAAVAPAGEERLREWVGVVRRRGLAAQVPPGRTAAAVGEAALGTPYEPYTLEAYLKAGGSPMRTEPLTLSLDQFDCVSLVESCLAIARLARGPGTPGWADFGREMERLRYRGGERGSYATRLHYFSEWMDDNAARGLLRPLGEELGGVRDDRPLRFMSEHRDAYPALADPQVYAQIQAMERALAGRPRWVVPTAAIAGVSDRIQTGDVLAFATAIDGLDVTHSAMAFRDPGGVLRVLHAPLSGGVVEITRSTLPEYVAAIRRATGVLVARPV